MAGLTIIHLIRSWEENKRVGEKSSGSSQLAVGYCMQYDAGCIPQICIAAGVSGRGESVRDRQVRSHQRSKVIWELGL